MTASKLGPWKSGSISRKKHGDNSGRRLCIKLPTKTVAATQGEPPGDRRAAQVRKRAGI